MKLTAKQQEVVNLIAAGWTLTASRGIGMNARSSGSLSNGDEHRAVPSDMGSRLAAKGIVERVAAGAWHSTQYRLTPLGQSLAVEPSQQRASKTWWAISRHYTNIESAEFESDTEAFLIDERGQKTKKRSAWRQWYPSREAAVAEMRKRLEGVVRAAERHTEEAKRSLAAFLKKEGLDD